jgi:hypothetical protein
MGALKIYICQIFNKQGRASVCVKLAGKGPKNIGRLASKPTE